MHMKITLKEGRTHAGQSEWWCDAFRFNLEAGTLEVTTSSGDMLITSIPLADVEGVTYSVHPFHNWEET